MPVWEYEHPVATVVIPLKDYDRLREELAALKRSVGETKQALDAERARVAELERENGQLRQLHWIEFMEQTEAEVFAGDSDPPDEPAE